MYSLTDTQLLVDVAGWFTGELTPPDSGVALNPPIPPPPSTTTTSTTAITGPPVTSTPTFNLADDDVTCWAAGEPGRHEERH